MNGTQTADVNLGSNNSEFTDCWFTGPGSAYFHVWVMTATNTVFTRCHFYEGETPFGVNTGADQPMISGPQYWYPSGAEIPANRLGL